MKFIFVETVDEVLKSALEPAARQKSWQIRRMEKKKGCFGVLMLQVMLIKMIQPWCPY
jgi:hypothetical protein